MGTPINWPGTNGDTHNFPLIFGDTHNFPPFIFRIFVEKQIAN